MKHLPQITLALSVVMILAGGFGMLFSFPFLWSNHPADLIGAGFPFVGGTVLVIGGLISMAIISGKEKEEKKA